ncbi:exonuclease domain-containing protein [Vibrio sp. YQ_11]|uniref:3'-5' exonuclease n=1 Tax=unclassified Vibrio TaxID=2614977 RepID=UPI00370B323E
METTLEFYCKKIEGFEGMSFEARREAVKAADLSTKMHNQSTLKEIFRVKPEKNAVSEYSYKNPYGRGKIECFRLEQCVPMRPLSSKPRTEAQKAATIKLVKQNEYNSDYNQAAVLANTFIEQDILVLDTETTDLEGVVIQVALVSLKDCKPIYQSLVHTDEPISDGAFRVHGISAEQLKDAPPFSVVAQEISELLGKRGWTAFNARFDTDALLRSIIDNKDAKRYAWIRNNRAMCTMYCIAVPRFGATNKYGTISLANSVAACSLSWEGTAHDATSDAVMTARMISHIAGQALTLEVEEV